MMRRGEIHAGHAEGMTRKVVPLVREIVACGEGVFRGIVVWPIIQPPEKVL